MPIAVNRETVRHEVWPRELLTLTVDQYHRMLETGILTNGEPIELLDGLLVVKDRGRARTLSPLHALLVSRLMKLAPEIEALGAHLRLQSPITIAPRNEPEPDGFIVAGSIEDFADRHPGPGDVSCVIEVAESSIKGRSELERPLPQLGLAVAGEDALPDHAVRDLVQVSMERLVELDELGP